jgi:hypothetical protein
LLRDVLDAVRSFNAPKRNSFRGGAESRARAFPRQVPGGVRDGKPDITASRAVELERIGPRIELRRVHDKESVRRKHRAVRNAVFGRRCHVVAQEPAADRDRAG